MVLHTLGQCLIRTAISTVTPRADMCFAIGAYLTRHRGTRTSRRLLESIFWPGVPAAHASHRLSELIRKLRRSGVPIHADDAACIWLPRDRVAVDVETLADQPASAIAASDLAILPGYSSLAPAALRDWVDDWRGHLQITLLDQLLLAADRAIDANMWAAARDLAAQALRIDPANERADVLLRASARRLQSSGHAGPVRPLTASPAFQPSSTAASAVTEHRPEGNFSKRAASSTQDDAYDVHLSRLLTIGQRLVRGESIASVLMISRDDWPSGLRRAYCAKMNRMGAVVAHVAIPAESSLTAYAGALTLAHTLRSLPGGAGCDPATTALLRRCLKPERTSLVTVYSSPINSVPPADIEFALVDLTRAVCEEQPLVILLEPEDRIDHESRRLFSVIPDRVVHSVWMAVVANVTECDAWTDIRHHRESLPLLEISEPESFGEACPGGLSPHDVQMEAPAHAHQPHPTSLQDRLADLGDTALYVLQAIAILGTEATIGTLHEVLRFETRTLFAALEELARTRLANYEPVVSPDAQHVVHLENQVKSAAMERISPHGLRLLHVAAAQALECGARKRQCADLYWACGDHWEAAGDSQRAAANRIASAEHLHETGRLEECLGRSREILAMVNVSPLRVSTLRTMAIAQHAARDWDALDQTVADVRRLENICSPSASVHDHLELCILNARSHSRRDLPETLRLAKACVSSFAADPAHRVVAAVIALKLGTDAGDLDTVDEVYRSVLPSLDHPGVSSRDRINLLMIFHTIRGDPGTAAILARDLLGIVQTDLPPVHQLVQLMDCADALRRFGETGEANRIYGTVFDLAIQTGVIDVARDASRRCIETRCDAGDYAIASAWISQYDLTSRATGDTPTACSLRVAIARVRISERKWRDADGLLEPPGRDPLWADPVAMVRSGALAAKVRLEAGRGATTRKIEKWVQALAESHALLGGTGARDYETFALFQGYRAIGEAAAATEMLRLYVCSQRRDTTPISNEIRTALANDVAEDV